MNPLSLNSIGILFCNGRRHSVLWNGRHQIVSCRRLVIGNGSYVGDRQTKQAGQLKKNRPGHGLKFNFFKKSHLGKKIRSLLEDDTLLHPDFFRLPLKMRFREKIKGELIEML
jgi:hypothetical protein